MLTFTTSMIIAVVCIIIGLGTGIIVAMAFSRGSDNRKTPPRDYPFDQIAVLLRDKRDASLLAEIDGRFYASTETLNDGQRELLEKTVKDLRAWLRLPLEPESVAEIAPESTQRSAAAPVRTTPLPPLVRPSAMDAPAPASTGNSANQADKKRPAPARSIVEQIDEILQDMVAGTPLAQKSIRLVDDPARGVIVWIGLEHYEGINAVPDIEARTIIQAAVREWEKKSEAQVK